MYTFQFQVQIKSSKTQLTPLYSSWPTGVWQLLIPLLKSDTLSIRGHQYFYWFIKKKKTPVSPQFDHTIYWTCIWQMVIVNVWCHGTQQTGGPYLQVWHLCCISTKNGEKYTRKVGYDGWLDRSYTGFSLWRPGFVSWLWPRIKGDFFLSDITVS